MADRELLHPSGMGKSKRPQLLADEQRVLEHWQVWRVTSPQEKVRCDAFIVEHHYLPKTISRAERTNRVMKTVI